MLTITVPAKEIFDEDKNEFLYCVKLTKHVILSFSLFFQSTDNEFYHQFNTDSTDITDVKNKRK